MHFSPQIDLINRVDGQLLYDRMIGEAQIPVANICNVPHVVFSIVRPNYRVNVHRTGTRYMGVLSRGNLLQSARSANL